MALTLTGWDGFDLYPEALADFPSGAAVRSIGNGTDCIFTAAAARTAGQGIQFLDDGLEGNDNIAATDIGLLYPLDNPQLRSASVIAGASVRLDGATTSSIFSLIQVNGEIPVGLRVTSAGFLEVRAGVNSTNAIVVTASEPLPLGEWAFVEWYINVTPQVGDDDDLDIMSTIIRINGAVVAEMSLSDVGFTDIDFNLTDIAIGVAPSSAFNATQGGQFSLDNFYYGNQSGPTPAGDFLGERAVLTRRADNVDTVGTVGFTQLDTGPVLDALTSFDGASTGFQGNVPGDVLTVTSSDVFGFTVQSIDGVLTVHASAKDGIGAREVSPFVRAGSANFSSSADSLGEGFGVRQSAPFLTNPATSAAWTQADVEALGWGLEITA